MACELMNPPIKVKKHHPNKIMKYQNELPTTTSKANSNTQCIVKFSKRKILREIHHGHKMIECGSY